MTPQYLLLFMGCVMLGMAIAKKSDEQQSKYIRVALFAFGAGFIIAGALWK